MNAKNTWIWFALAVGLFAFIFFFERHWGKPPPGPAPLLPGFKAVGVTGVRIFVESPQPQEIRAELTNAQWWITQPIRYPAQKTTIDALLSALEKIIPDTIVSRNELQRPEAEAEFGFDHPQASLVIQQETTLPAIKFGRRTAPGNQVFVQVVGREDIYVVDAEVLNFLPASVDEWRDRALVDFRDLRFNSINITNAGRVIKLQLDPTNQTWQLIQPLEARADDGYLLGMMQQLQQTRITEFVPEERRPDLDALGLQPPELSIAFAKGIVNAVLLQFGRTNAAGQIYGRRDDLNAVVTVPSGVLAAWQQHFSKFRDLRLLTPPPGLVGVEILGPEKFALERSGTNQWRLVAEKFPVDAAAADGLLGLLASLEIVEFVKDVVSAPEFGAYGLTSAVQQIVFKTAPASGETNSSPLRLEFGASTNGIIYGRRSDEASVYALRLADFQKLPTAAWQLRERRLWGEAPPELARLSAHKGEWKRDLVRSGTNSWVFGAGSQGVLDVECTRQLAYQLEQIRATLWVARGPAAADDTRFGFGTNSLMLTLETSKQEKMEIQFGGYSSENYPFARVTLDGEPWVFEFPSMLYRFLLACLTVPPGAP
jgi:hypothetical protein